MAVYGYVRVSTTEQNEDRQMDAMKRLNMKELRIYMDKQSGKDFNRPQYLKMVKKMKKGDLLFVTSLDRLGRNYEEIKEQWRKLTKIIGIDICVIDNMSLLDTRIAKDTLGSLISDLVLSILSYFAETERTMIRRRQAEGIAAAKARGVQFGRKPLELPAEFKKTVSAWETGDLNIHQALEICRMKPATFYRRVKDLREKERGKGITRCTF